MNKQDAKKQLRSATRPTTITFRKPSESEEKLFSYSLKSQKEKAEHLENVGSFFILSIFIEQYALP